MRKFEFLAKGHPLIRATHKSTFEITTESFLTPRGDCIIGISSTHSAQSLPEDLKEHLRKGGQIRIVLMVDDIKDEVIAYGHPNLTFISNISMVFRKSDYIDDRTVAIRANKAAKDLRRDLVSKLRDGATLKVIIYY